MHSGTVYCSSRAPAPPCAAADPPAGQSAAVFKASVNESSLGLSPTDVLYIRDSPPAGDAASSSRGSSLSAGAIAGIAVGATVAAAVAAGAGWVLLRRRRSIKRATQDGSTAAKECGSVAGGTHSRVTGEAEGLKAELSLDPPAPMPYSSSFDGLTPASSVAAAVRASPFSGACTPPGLGQQSRNERRRGSGQGAGMRKPHQPKPA